MPVRSATQNDIFGQLSESEPEPLAGPRPLADRLRPRSLDEVVGQDHLLGHDGTLTRMLARGSLASLILWGPPGCGRRRSLACLPPARAFTLSSFPLCSPVLPISNAHSMKLRGGAAQG